MRSGLQETLAAHKPELDRLGVKSLSVFGSVARGDETDTSDLDVLVEFSGLRRSMRSWTSRSCSSASRVGASTW